MSKRLTGSVVSYDIVKRFGFITSGGKEYFVHESFIISYPGFQILVAGQTVEFSPWTDEFGRLQAHNVSVQGNPHGGFSGGGRVTGGGVGRGAGRGYGGGGSSSGGGGGYDEIPVVMIYDIEKSPYPNLTIEDLIGNINKSLKTFNTNYVLRNMIIACGDHIITEASSKSFTLSGPNAGCKVQCTRLPKLKPRCDDSGYDEINYVRVKEAANFLLIHQLLLDVFDNRGKKTPKVVLIVSADQDFRFVMNDLRGDGFTVLLGANFDSNRDYLNMSDACWIWDNMTQGLKYDWIRPTQGWQVRY